MGTLRPLLDRKFHAAVSIVQNLPKSGPISTPLSTMLQFYALYKQATEGPNLTSKPAFYDIVRKTKWDAWTKLGSLSKEEAMQRYIEDFVAIVDSTTLGSNVEELIKSLGNLYEAVDDEDIDLLLGPTIDKLLAKSGCPKLARMKNKLLKSGDNEEMSNDNRDKSCNSENKSDDNAHMSSDKVNETSDEFNSSLVPPLNSGDRRFETKQSQYYMAAPSEREEVQVRDAYQLKSGGGGGVRIEKNGDEPSVTTWSQCIGQPDASLQRQMPNTISPGSQQLTSAQSRLSSGQYDLPPAAQLDELSIVSKSVISIEQELTHVAEKLNSISKLYKYSQCYNSISIPTLSLILVWPVVTQLGFMWYSSRTRQTQTFR